MSYNARIRALQRRSTGNNCECDNLCERSWMTGSSQANGIGISSRLTNTIRNRTNTINVQNSIITDSRNNVVVQNQLSGVGRFRSQFFRGDGVKYTKSVYMPIFSR